MKFKQKFKLGKITISKNTKPILVAEISANHNGSLSTAKKLILSAKKNGADFVKLQTYEADTMTFKTNKKDFIIEDGLWKGQSLWDLYDKAKTPFAWQKELFDYAKEINIQCFSTPFDHSALALLEKIGCPFYKISSFENQDLELIKKIAKTKKPVIISTGITKINDLEKSIQTIYKYGNKKIIILYCASSYPAKYKDFNIKNLKEIQKKFNCLVGLSDHCNDNLVGISAINHGAVIFEKHFALENQKKGYDLDFSKKGKELLKYKKDLENTWIINNNNKQVSADEIKNLKFKRSIYTSKNIKKGDLLTKNNLRCVRPGFGLSPLEFSNVIGKVAKRNISKFTALNYKMF
jgi:pseudaminic acid synthase